MATPRMDITSFVGKLLEEDDVDLLREGVRVLAQALMETEVSSQIGAAPYERVPHQDVGHPGGDHRAQDPQGHRRHLLSLRARAPEASREGPSRRGV